MTALATEAPAAQAMPSALGLYAGLSAAERYIHRTRDATWIAMLRRNGVETLPGRAIAELGCGDGAFLRTLLHYGADASRLAAVDVDARRVARARAALPGVSITVGDIACLPYEDASFDLAFAFTAFSSMLDLQARRHAGLEAMRILRPAGVLVVYDFWTNPTNRRVRAFPEGELRHMFSGRPVEIERVTLAPPIVRLLRGRRGLCRPLERLPLLRTHLLAVVKKEAS
jgi:SAM-dependent methyltransferase